MSIEKAAAAQLRALAPQLKRPTHAQSLRMADLREELAIRAAQRLRCTSDDVICLVHVIVDLLISDYGGTHLYVPVLKGARVDPLAEKVRAEHAKGRSGKWIRSRFKISYDRLQSILA